MSDPRFLCPAFARVSRNDAGRRSPGSGGRAAKILFVLVLVVSLAPLQFAMAAGAGCPTADASSGSYKIGPGDVLHISVWQNKNLDRVVTVRPDGMVSFPLVNDIRAAGRTPMELQGALTKKLGLYLTNPQATVVVQQVRSFTVSVLGEVQHPGRYEMRSDGATVLDVLAQAGGFTNFANKGDIGVLRKGPKGTQRIPFRYKKAISGNPGNSDFCVEPGDIVIVP